MIDSQSLFCFYRIILDACDYSTKIIRGTIVKFYLANTFYYHPILRQNHKVFKIVIKCID